MSGIRHTGIYVKDLDAMISFYKDIFFLKIVVQQKECGAYIDTVLGEENVDIETCKLEFDNKTMIELVHYARREEEPDWNEKIYRCGKMHIAVTVDSADGIYEKLRKRGCELLSEPCNSPNGKARVFFVRDPEGNYLELVEELKE